MSVCAHTLDFQVVVNQQLQCDPVDQLDSPQKGSQQMVPFPKLVAHFNNNIPLSNPFIGITLTPTTALNSSQEEEGPIDAP